MEYGGYDFTVDMSYHYYKPTCMKFGPDGLMYVCDDIQHRLVRYNVSSGTAVFHSHSDMVGGDLVYMNGVDFANNHVPQSPEEVVAYVRVTDYNTATDCIKRATNLSWDSGCVYEVNANEHMFISFTVLGDSELFLNQVRTTPHHTLPHDTVH